MLGIHLPHCAEQPRIISEASENKLDRAYSLIQYFLIGSLGALAIVNTLGKFIDIPKYISISWLGSGGGVSVDTVSIIIGGVLALSAAKIFRLN